MLQLSGEGQQRMAMVHPWKDYASARAAWRARRQTSMGKGGPTFLGVRGAVSAQPPAATASVAPLQGSMAMDVDWQKVREKRPRNEQR